MIIMIAIINYKHMNTLIKLTSIKQQLNNFNNTTTPLTTAQNPPRCVQGGAPVSAGDANALPWVQLIHPRFILGCSVNVMITPASTLTEECARVVN